MTLDFMLYPTEKKEISPGKELETINKIKESLLDILNAFSEDLPKQYGVQFQSYAQKMGENNEFLWDKKELLGFLWLYKLQLEDLVGKMDERPERNQWHTEKKDEYVGIKTKISNYSSTIEEIFTNIQKREVENLDVIWFGQYVDIHFNGAKRPTERNKEDTPPEE